MAWFESIEQILCQRSCPAACVWAGAKQPRRSAKKGCLSLGKRADVEERSAEILRECERINAASTELAIERAISKESFMLKLDQDRLQR